MVIKGHGQQQYSDMLQDSNDAQVVLMGSECTKKISLTA